MSAEDPPISGTTRVLTADVAPERAADVAAALRELIHRIPAHVALVPILDAGVRGRHPYIVTPHVPGEPLDSALATYGPAALADALPRLQQLADALDLAARHGVCHGRLAPEDIVISGDDTRIVGMGVAPTLRDLNIAVAIGGPYVAPEVLEGDPLTPASDQFGLAVIAYEWLFGQHPQLVTGSVSPPSLPGVDAARLARAFERALAIRPHERFVSCTDFVRAIGDSSKVRAFAPPAADLLLHAPDPVVDESATGQYVQARGGPPAKWSGVRLAVVLAIGIALGAIAVRYYAQGESELPDSGQAYTDAAITDDSPPAREVAEPEIKAAPDDAREAAPAPVAPPPAVAARPKVQPPVPVRAMDDAVPAAQLDAGLLVHSVPAGALVTIDGTPRGTTPVAIRGLELGSRSVMVSLPGYRSIARQVVLTSDRPSRALEIALTPMTRTGGVTPARYGGEGGLVIDSRPAGAAVFVDGRPVGVTPLTLTIAPGPHTVRLEHAGHRPVTTRVEVKEGERARVAARLEGGQDEQ